VLGVLGYASLVVILRVSGRRTLSKMNAFDLVVTVALGSILATVILSKDSTLAQGSLAFALLVGMQFLMTWSSVRWRWVRRDYRRAGAALLRGGLALPALKAARVTPAEVKAAVRSQGIAYMDAVTAVVIETDGSFSVVTSSAGARSSLDGVAPPAVDG
jgi:uncharacterized membrane protein YcaP (DUF421 family)